MVLLLIVIGIGAASFIAIEGEADFPGAESLRAAGSEGKGIYQRLSGNGDSGQAPSAQPPAPTQAHPSGAASPSTATGQSEEQAAARASQPSPVQKHHQYKAYMLELINAERRSAGAPPVTLGDNIAAQLHAEISLANCFSGHWGVDGLKPYMRYSLAGGYQYNSENASGSDYCISESDGHRPLDNIETEIREMMNGWMNSAGHRRNILDQRHVKVNIGLAWNDYNIAGYQHFEGGYVEYDRLPEITDGTLTVSGRVTNGLQFFNKEQVGLQIYYDRPPRTLTLGQLARTYCYDSGVLVAGFGHFPIDVDLDNLDNIDLTDIGLSEVDLGEVGLSDVNLNDVDFWAADEFKTTYTSCPDPYEVPPDAHAPRSPAEARSFWQEAYLASENRPPQPITVKWITASKWMVRGADFSITADISDLLSQHGWGVYSVLLWGEVGGARVPISKYSIFHGVNPPNTYNPGPWK